MQDQWDNDKPIYRQLHDRVVGLILDGEYSEGEAIPSVRALSAELQVNHLTVSKAYQELVDAGLVEKRRGLGMFVAEGAQEKILNQEKSKFLSSELPQLVQRTAQLGISPQELIQTIEACFGGQANDTSN